MNLSELSARFQPNEIEWRVQSCGNGAKGIWARAVAYITNRAVESRLDAVCGQGNWRNELRPVEGGMLCGISIFIGGEWVTKWDGAPNNPDHPIKGVISAAMKRAAVLWGIGRYLYDIDLGFAKVHPGGKFRQAANKAKQIEAFNWDPPPVPRDFYSSASAVAIAAPAATPVAASPTLPPVSRPEPKPVDRPPLPPSPTGIQPVQAEAIAELLTRLGTSANKLRVTLEQNYRKYEVEALTQAETQDLLLRLTRHLPGIKEVLQERANELTEVQALPAWAGYEQELLETLGNAGVSASVMDKLLAPVRYAWWVRRIELADVEDKQVFKGLLAELKEPSLREQLGKGNVEQLTEAVKALPRQLQGA